MSGHISWPEAKEKPIVGVLHINLMSLMPLLKAVLSSQDVVVTIGCRRAPKFLSFLPNCLIFTNHTAALTHPIPVLGFDRKVQDGRAAFLPFRLTSPGKSKESVEADDIFRHLDIPIDCNQEETNRYPVTVRW
jgi:hypothetical protein